MSLAVIGSVSEIVVARSTSPTQVVRGFEGSRKTSHIFAWTLTGIQKRTAKGPGEGEKSEWAADS